jgi:heme/copper-type cytochrome/quinol oxidase subunit 2
MESGEIISPISFEKGIRKTEDVFVKIETPDNVVVKIFYNIFLVSFGFYEVGIPTVLGLQKDNLEYKKINIALFVMSFVFGLVGAEYLLVTYYLRNQETKDEVDVKIFETLKYYPLVFAAFIFVYLPWPQLLNYQNKCYHSTNDNYIWIVFTASVLYYSIFFFGHLVLIKVIREFAGEVDTKYRIRFTEDLVCEARPKRENDNVNRISDAVELFENNYSRMKGISRSLTRSVCLTFVEFSISTVLIFYLIFDKCSYDYITIALTTTSSIPFIVVSLTVVVFNECITKMENDLGIATDLPLEICGYRFDWKFLVSCGSSVFSYLYKNFVGN